MRASLIIRSFLGASALAILSAQGVLAQGGFIVDVPAGEKRGPAPVKSHGGAQPPAPALPAAKPAAVVPAQPEPVAIAPKTENENRLAPLDNAGQQPDESALRYYASLQQTARVETEIKRLQRLYPDWRPPENLSATPSAGGVDEQPLWDLFSLNQIEKLHAEIARRKLAEPNWTPSEDLLDKIRKKETRNKIASLWESGKWKDMIAFVKEGGIDPSEADIDIAWTVAEAYAKVKQTSDALTVYKSIISNGAHGRHRIATIQKAMAVLSMKHVEEIIALVKPDANGRSELDPIAIDITRGRISAFLHDERKDLIPADELNKFEEFARKDKDPNQPGLVAWYHYKNKSVPQALEWFKHAITQGGDSMIAHGLAHSLRELGLYRDTEEVTYAWRQPLIHNAILFIDILERDLTKEIPPYIEPHRLKRYAEVTMDTASGEGAQGLAWYAYNTCQFPVALEWFERAVSWLPKEATVYGYALALRRMKKTKEFWETLNRYDGLFPKVIEIIYPDGYYHPPTPCDLINNRSAQQKYQQHYANGAAFSVPAPHVAGQPLAGGPQAFGYGQYQRGPVAQPAQTSASSPQAYPQQSFQPAMQPAAPQAWNGGAQNFYRASNPNDREPRIDRKLFPVAVDPQNPLRHYPAGRYMGPPAAPAAQSPAAQTALPREPVPGMRMLVARRTPGVGTMPYERWGYQLLPGFNGITAASPPHNAARAPEGTLWTTLHAKDAQATIAGAADPLRQDITALLERLARAPRVPSPSASLNGPWNSPKPYKSREQLESEGLLQPSQISAGPAQIAAQIPASIVRTQEPSAGQQAGGHAIRIAATDTLAVQANAQYNAGQYPAVLETLDRRMRNHPETEDIKLMRAWSLLHSGNVDEARKIFSSLGPAARRNSAAAPAESRTR